MTTVMVTGGAGYIGAHTCKALRAAGFTPVTFDNLSTGHSDAVRWGPLHLGDILNRGDLDAAFKAYRPAAVVHFAGSALVGESTRNPTLYFRNNTLGSLTLFEASCAHGAKALVFSSTCATYGSPIDGRAISEEFPQRPINPYGASKLAVEHLLMGFSAAFDFKSVALRYFNAAGASLDGDVGEFHAEETHLIPLAIEAALGVRGPLAIFGSDYDTPDGTAVRDYVHVCDLAEAHVAAVRHLLNGGQTLQINLGAGAGTSVRQVVSAVESHLGVLVPCVEAPRRPGDPVYLVADTTRAESALGWRAKLSDLRTIVSSASAWHRQLASQVSGARRALQG